MKLKISEILKATGGKLLCGDETAVVRSFSTDSREIKSGTMFVPIKGERVDSHIYIKTVLETAAASFTQEENVSLPQDTSKPVILVKNTVTALQKAAAYYRDQFSIPLIGITGSVGKTTSKEMIALALSSSFNVLKTAGNQNSQIGVPLTVCRLKKEHEAAVVEMGVSIPGEMERIAQVAKPSCAVLTNIGVSHIEFMKSRENIMEEKLHIADYIAVDGPLFVNGDDDLLSTLKGKLKKNVMTFGMGFDCDFRATQLRPADNGTYFTYEGKGEREQVYVPAAGMHNVRNALVSLAVARYFGVDMESAVRAIASYKAPAMRQQFFKTENFTIIDDSYNASPDSVKGALDVLSDSGTQGQKIAVLGDMKELGNKSKESHFEIGQYAAKKGIDFLICVGEMSKNTCLGFGDEKSMWLDSNEKVIGFLKAKLKRDDIVLIKGSRSGKLDEIVAALKEM